MRLSYVKIRLSTLLSLLLLLCFFITFIIICLRYCKKNINLIKYFIKMLLKNIKFCNKEHLLKSAREDKTELCYVMLK